MVRIYKLLLYFILLNLFLIRIRISKQI
jgi:hypothetical protein